MQSALLETAIPSVRLSVRLSSLSLSHFFVDFHQIWHRGVNPKTNNDFVGGQYRPTPSPILPLKIAIFGPEVLKINANMKNAISAWNVHETPKFALGEHDGDVRFLNGSRNIAVSRMRNEKCEIWPLFMACLLYTSDAADE